VKPGSVFFGVETIAIQVSIKPGQLKPFVGKAIAMAYLS
jgi:hypothetical protein